MKRYLFPQLLAVAVIAVHTAETTFAAAVCDDEMLPVLSVDSAFHLNDVVVTGTRTPKLLKDSPIQTRVISSADLRKSAATNVAEFLQQEVAGVELSLAMNQHTHLNMSGFGGHSVLFLVNGERLAGETLDDVDFARLSLSQVERIEIVKGAASALYGSSATGGVVNIILREPSEPWAVDYRGHLSRRQQQQQLSVSTRSSRWRNVLSASMVLNDCYRLRNGANPSGRVVSQVFGDSSITVADRLTWHPTATLALSGDATYFQRHVVRTADAPDLYRDLATVLRGVWTPASDTRWEVAYHFDQYDKATSYRLSHLTTRQYSNVQHSLRILCSQRLSAGSQIAVGGDYMADYLENSRLRQGRHRQRVADAFVQYDWQPAARIELVGALRYDYFSQHHLSRLTPKFSVRYTLDDHWTLRTAYGMGFRAPSLKERYYEFDMAGIWTVKGNDALKAESSHNLSLSADYTRGRYNVVVAAYYNKVRNKLATGLPYYDDGGQLSLDYVNLDGYAVCGGDVTLQARFGSHLSGRLSYAFTHEQLPADGEGHSVSSQYLPARPHALTARLDWQHRFSRRYALRLSLNGRLLSAVRSVEYADYYDVSRGYVEVRYPAYTLWRLAAEQQLGAYCRLTVAVDNLFAYRPRHYYMNSPLTEGAALQATLAVSLHPAR